MLSPSWVPPGAVLLALLTPGLCGCIPLPFATPPMRATLTAGGAAGRPVPAAEPTRGVVEPVLTGRFGIYPAQVIEPWRERRFDLGVGYVFELFPDAELSNYTKHGAFIRGTWHPWQPTFEPGGNARTRVGLHAIGELLFDERDGDMGAGAALAASFDLIVDGWGDFAAADSDGAIIGSYGGEVGVGFEVSVGFRQIGGLRYFTTGIGITITLPASAGVVLVPLWALLDEDDDNDEDDDEDDDERPSVEVRSPERPSVEVRSPERPSVEVRRPEDDEEADE